MEETEFKDMIGGELDVTIIFIKNAAGASAPASRSSNLPGSWDP